MNGKRISRFLAEVVTHAFYTVCAVIILAWLYLKATGAL